MYRPRPGKLSVPLFYKYFLSYIVIFLIPFIVISLVFYYSSVNNLRNEIVSSNINQLEQVRNMTDLRMKELREIATRISYDPRLTPYMVSQPYSGKQAIDDLRRYKANSSIIRELILYYRGTENVYSPRGISTVDALLKGLQPVNEKEYIEFKDQLNAVKQSVVRPLDFIKMDTGASERLIAFQYPIPSNNSTAHGSVTFLVEEEMLTDLIKDILGEMNGNVYIFNDQHTILTNKHDVPLRPENISQLSVSSPGVTEKQFGSNHYSVVTVQSDLTGWSFVAAIPEAQFYAKVADFQLFLLVTLAFIALIGLGAAVLLTFRQYKPIRSLSHYLGAKNLPYTNKQHKHNDLVRIRDTMEIVFENSEQLRKQMNVQEPFVRDQCLMKLLKGDSEDLKETNELLRELQITWDGKYFFVIMCTFNKGQLNEKSLKDREAMLQILSHVSFRDGEAYGFELIHDHAVVLIVNLNDNEMNLLRKSQKYLLQRLEEKLKNHSKTIPYIGVGTIYEGVNLINRSFIEAKAASEYTLMYKEGHIVYFDEVVEKEEKDFWYPADQKVTFIQGLKQGDYEVARETLTEIMDYILVKEISLHVLRCMCFDIINTVLKTVLEMGLNHYVNDIKKLIEFGSIEELEKNMQALVAQVCKEVDQNKESNNVELRDGILAYIDEHYKMQSFSLEEMAGVFQVSISYLSRFIKDQTGTTFTELVWQLRVNEVRKQLKESDRSIKDIVADVGYHDTANFIRKFKKSEGLTPGQYRQEVNVTHRINGIVQKNP